MTTPDNDSNVIPIGRNRVNREADANRLKAAQEKVSEALDSSGEERTALAEAALAISKDCVDAYLILAETNKSTKQRMRLYSDAIDAAERSLGSNWRAGYEGRFWKAPETRPLMRALARQAMAQQSDDELDAALTTYRNLMKMNPDDNQGIRYLLANCLFEGGCSDELEELLAEYADDPSAALLYTEALHLYRKKSPRSKMSLLRAFRANIHVPMLLSDIFEMPDEPPSSIGFGDDNEAVAYVMDHGYLWWETEGATKWMAQILGPELRKASDDHEFVDEAIAALMGELED